MKKHAESHMDHGFTQEQWDFLFNKFADKTAFFIDTVELPEGLGTVTNDLYGPSAGDPPVPETEVFYTKRGERTWNSRLVDKPKRPTKFVRVIAGAHADKCDGCEGKGTLPVETLHHEWKDETCLECRGSGKGTIYDCILYTAYGVPTIDGPAAPKEPGDIARRWTENREKIRALPPGIDIPRALVDAYFDDDRALNESTAFWAQHALAALAE